MKNGLPTIAFCGYGRCGKDTASEFFHDHTCLKFIGGCSWSASHYMAKRLSEDYGRLVTPEEAYETRHSGGDELRMKWFNYMNEFREGDPLAIFRLCLEHSDIICGPRAEIEIKGGRELVDLFIWVARPGIALDPTVMYSSTDCD